MSYSEQFAVDVLTVLLPGATVTPLRQQSHGEHDVDVVYPDGRRAAVEVASIVNRAQLEMISAVLSPKHGSDTLPAHVGEGGWYVTPRLGANVRRIRRELDRCLASLDAAGIGSFDRHLGDLPDELIVMVNELGLESGDRVDFAPRGEIRIGLPGDGGWVYAAAVNHAVDEALAREDNRRKLAAGDYDERHLFVYVDSSAHDPFAALLHPELAPPPQLPPPISHVWVGTFVGNLTHGVVWVAEAGEEWRRIEVQLPDRERGDDTRADDADAV